ncbi:glycosyltransferase family A protein [Peribacillus frigoritolerans]|uniref:glycosyltransferase n=1 Tax=Peribacillus frigoritolerans TaxID=450367 RepID=UPI00207A2B9F|nr:glycosyltransferase family A protein [Peribacillus frigoritolerans]USK82051.1 glycosyltransferase [Peribacillus frigoritolerans]WJE49342.1 glycosyltransferase family A protein [Peribacillus frigoritolerans]
MVSIICCTIRQHLMENVFQNYNNQVWKEKELIIILNRNDMSIDSWEIRAKFFQDVSIYQLQEEWTLGECLNFGIEKAKYDFIAKFDDDDYYSPNYLAQSMECFNKTNADLIGKRTIFMYFEDKKILAIHKPGKENKIVNQGLKGATLIFKKEIINKVRFPKLNLGEDTFFIRQCIKNRLKVYSTDKNNYVCLRTSLTDHHTWDINNELLLRKSFIVCKTDDYKPFVLG